MKRRGIISHSLNILLPFSQFANKMRMSRWLQKVVLALVKYYQRSLSPHKGFSCAYRKLYRDSSCSQFFVQAINQYGLRASIPLFQKRLEACHRANKTLNVIKSINKAGYPAKNKRRKNNCNAIDCRRCDILDLIDCYDSDCNGVPDCLECDTPDCLGCDNLNVCDCG